MFVADIEPAGILIYRRVAKGGILTFNADRVIGRYMALEDSKFGVRSSALQWDL